MKASAPSYDYESVLPSNSTRLRKSTELREKETKGSKYARARVMLKHGEDRVNLEGNLMSDIFTSLFDELTGIFTMLTVYRTFDPDSQARYFPLNSTATPFAPTSLPIQPTEHSDLYKVAYCIYLANAAIRFCIGLRALVVAPKGLRWKRISGEGITEESVAGVDSFSCQNLEYITWSAKFWAIVGLILIVLEPVSGMHIITHWVYEDAPTMTKKKDEELKRVRDSNMEQLSEAEVDLKEIEEATTVLAAFALALEEKAPDLKDTDLMKSMADSARECNELSKESVDAIMQRVGLINDFVDTEYAKAALLSHTTKFELARKRLKGREFVQIIMASLEDIPEIILAIVFGARYSELFQFTDASGNKNQAELFTFATNIAVSAFHCFKCFWQYRRINKLVKSAKPTQAKNADNLQIYNGLVHVAHLNNTWEEIDAISIKLKNKMKTVQKQIIEVKENRNEKFAVFEDNMNELMKAYHGINAVSVSGLVRKFQRENSTKNGRWPLERRKSFETVVALQEHFESGKAPNPKINRLAGTLSTPMFKYVQSFYKIKLIPVVERVMRDAMLSGNMTRQLPDAQVRWRQLRDASSTELLVDAVQRGGANNYLEVQTMQAESSDDEADSTAEEDSKSESESDYDNFDDGGNIFANDGDAFALEVLQTGGGGENMGATLEF